MKGIFGKSSKNPAEIVRNLKDDLNTLEKGGDGKKQEKAQGRMILQSSLQSDSCFQLI